MEKIKAAQDLEKRKQALGEEAGKLFGHIEADLYNLRSLWRTYVSLFGTNSERVELLNSISSLTSYHLEKSLYDSAMLAICRLTDPPQSHGSGPNVSVRRLPDLLNLEGHSDLHALVEKAGTTSKFARSWRNKKLAHSDDAVRNGKATLDHSSRIQMNVAIEAISDVVKWVGRECMDTQIMTMPIVRKSSDEVAFLRALFEGKECLEDRERRMKDLLRKRDYLGLERLIDKDKNPEWLVYMPPDEFY
ncbi:AbiU2 domain-containing protein [Oceanibium sediminis]|uniref:AbiU2 domain-containing protein n=1 Tax=Oceanibium sediminis TaxID=2026339 RepID=UPI0013004AEB|nr:hypothetical protein [Oceanibium sediminis]